jgi:hypothetical protein
MQTPRLACFHEEYQVLAEGGSLWTQQVYLVRAGVRALSLSEEYRAQGGEALPYYRRAVYLDQEVEDREYRQEKT